MKVHNSSQAGVGHIVAVLVLVFVAVVGFAGYKVVSMNGAGDTKVAPAATEQKADAEAINSQADLKKADATLTESESQLDSSLNDKELDADLDSML